MGTLLAFHSDMLQQGRIRGETDAGVARESVSPVADELCALRSQVALQARQLEETEQRWMDAMERSQRQADILALYAHDLRSPLAAILGYADLLEMGVPEALPGCAVESVSRIREAAQNLKTLLDQLLARPDSAPQLR